MSRSLPVSLTALLCLAVAPPLHAQDDLQSVQMPDIRGQLAAIPQAPVSKRYLLGNIIESIWAWGETTMHHGSNRYLLWNVIQCLNDQSPALQASPTSPARACGTVVLDKTPDAVILGDDKMFACNANANAAASSGYAYVHAQAVPLAQMTGVEQEEGRPQGIWDLAWRNAALYIPGAGDIILAANPRSHRTQDQFHVHIARLKPGAKDEILHPKRGSRRVPPAYIDHLSGSPDPVWAAAERNAGELAAKLGTPPGLKSGAFGVAVVYDEGRGQYAVIAAEGSPEWDFDARCPVSE